MNQISWRDSREAQLRREQKHFFRKSIGICAALAAIGFCIFVFSLTFVEWISG